MLHSAMAAAATLISLAFALSTWERWLAGRKRQELAWTVALVMFAGALWSAYRLLRGRAPARLAAANLIIALGTLVLSAGGLLNSALDEMDAFAVSLVAGITLIFVGFLLASSG